jgi:hypothetical protein
VSDFAVLLEELDRWETAGMMATLWLRDDDATKPSAQLDTLLDLSSAARVPVVLAVIAMRATPSLAERVAAKPALTVWQHGILHYNNAPLGAKKTELAAADPPTLAGLAEGGLRLADLFGDRFQPVLVPPWNRIAPDLIPRLPQTGLCALSIYRPRTAAFAAPDVALCNTHVDLLDWRKKAAFIGVAEACAGIARHLAARRIGTADPSEPTGILTHHEMMPDAAWDFLSSLFALTSDHSAARWCVPFSEHVMGP